MRVPISIGGLFSEKILLSVRNFPTFVSKITTFNLFKSTIILICKAKPSIY